MVKWKSNLALLLKYFNGYFILTANPLSLFEDGLYFPYNSCLSTLILASLRTRNSEILGCLIIPVHLNITKNVLDRGSRTSFYNIFKAFSVFCFSSIVNCTLFSPVHCTAASQVYERFLRDVWEHRDEVEDVYSDERIPPPAYELNYQRPPAPLPNQYHTHTNKSTSSNR